MSCRTGSSESGPASRRRLSRMCSHLSAAAALRLSQRVAAAPTTAAGGDVQHPRRFEATDPMEDQAAFFNTHGYCFVENALAGSELKAAQDAYQRHAGPTRELWQRAVQSGPERHADVGTYGNTTSSMTIDMGPPYGEVEVQQLPDHSWDIPRVAELDDAFLKLAEVPSLMPLLFEVMGRDLELMQINLRTTVGDQPGGQNRGWHRDMESMDEGWSHPTLASRVKIFVYLYDVAANGGMTGIVPDTFRRPDNPQTAGLDPTEDPPGAMLIHAKAGSAMVFDIHSWHSGTPNQSDAERVACSCQYSTFGGQFPQVLVQAQRLEAAGKLNTPLRRQLWGVEKMYKAEALRSFGKGRTTIDMV